MSLADRILTFDGTDWTAGLPSLLARGFRGRVHPFTFGYSLPPSPPPPEQGRADPDGGAFVFAVVGTRLDYEVDGDFLARLDGILDACPDAVVAFAGPVVDLVPRLAAMRNAARTRATGHLTDILGFYRRCGAYLNPPRQGGGASAAYALAEGVPVVTLPSGDVAGVAGPDFHAPDATAFAERARSLYADADFRATQATAARARFAAVGDRATATAHLLTHCREARAAFVGAGGT